MLPSFCVASESLFVVVNCSLVARTSISDQHYSNSNGENNNPLVQQKSSRHVSAVSCFSELIVQLAASSLCVYA